MVVVGAVRNGVVGLELVGGESGNGSAGDEGKGGVSVLRSME